MTHKKAFTIRLNGKALTIFEDRKKELEKTFPGISDNKVIANIILSLKKAEMEV